MVADKGISVSDDRSGDNQQEFTRDKIRAAQGPVLFRIHDSIKAYVCRYGHTLSADEAVNNTVAGWILVHRFSREFGSPGAGVYCDDQGRKHHLGVRFFRLPDYQHSTQLEPEPYSEHWLVVSPLIYMHLRGLGLIDVRRPVLQLPEDQIAPVESLFAELAEVPRGKQDYGMPEWQLFLQRAVALLACIQEHGQSDVDYPTGPRWMAAAVGLLKGNLANNPSLEQIAANLGVHEQTLRKQFKAHMGVSPIAYRNNYRIEVARHELLTRSVADVAAFTGFQDTKHFARQFKLKTGYSPREYVQLGRRAISLGRPE